MKKIIGSILLVIPLACGNPSQKESQNQLQLTAETAPAIKPVDLSTADTVDHQDTLSACIQDKIGFTATGKVKAADYADIYFRSQELIAHVYIKTGQRVRKGEILADLDTFSFNNQLREAKIALAQADLELKDILIGQGYSPDSLQSVPKDILKLARIKSGYEQAELQKEKAMREIKNATLNAPFDGIVANLTARPHQMSSSSEPFCRIIRNTDMEVEFSVLESELHLIRMGQKVKIEPQAVTIGVQTGDICSINPIVNDKGMIQVRARVKGNVGLMEGMNVTVIIQSHQQ